MTLRQDREFLKLWAGQTISVFGDQVTILALPLAAVLTLHASAFQMGVLTAVGWLPNLLFALHAGVWVDARGRRRQTMIAADLARVALLATVPVAYVAGVLSMAQLYAVAFAHGTVSVFFDLSSSVLFVSIVRREDFVEANSRLFQSRAFSFVAGPSIAGVLVQALTAPWALVADAFSFLGSAFFLGRIRADEPRPQAADGERLRTRVAAGLRFIFGNAAYRATLLSFSTINFFNLMFNALVILYATRELHIRPGTLGLILGLGAVGGLVGAIGAPHLSRAIGVGRSLVLGTLLFPAPLLLVPAARGPHALVLALLATAEFLSALGVMILDVNGNSLGAALSPDYMRARIAGAFRVINYGVRPVGSLLGGVLGAAIGLRPTLWIASIGATLAVLWLLPSPIPAMRELPEPA